MVLSADNTISAKYAVRSESKSRFLARFLLRLIRFKPKMLIDVCFCPRTRTLLVFFCLICTLTGGVASAQNEPNFTGCHLLPSVVNPAAAGASGLAAVTAAFRQQWVGFDDAPQSMLIAADMQVSFLKNFHGVGVLALQDKAGAMTNINLAAAYSFHIYLDKGILALGVRFGAVNAKFSASDLHTAPSEVQDGYHQETDPLLNGNDDSQTAFDAGLGAFYQSDNAFISLALQHLTAPKLALKSDAQINVRPALNVNAGRLLGKDVKQRSFEPRLAFMTDFASWQLELSAAANFNRFFWFALGARIQDALLAQTGVRLRNGLDLSYAYDLSLSKLKRYNTGSHEIIARYSFDFDRQKPDKRYKSVRIL